MAALAAAGGVALTAYLNGKYQLWRDASYLLRVIRLRKTWEKNLREGRASLWYLFTDVYPKNPNLRAIWSRDGCLTYQELYDKSVQYAQWMIEQGVKPKELVAFYHINHPDFIVIWLATMCIGAAPAFINYNLEGKSLLHCLSVCEAKLLIVDEDEGCQKRINDSRKEIEAMGMSIQTLDTKLRRNLASRPVIVPGDERRAPVKGDDPLVLIYTSGTTGMPKGAPFTVHRFHMTGCHIYPTFEGVPGEDRLYNSMPLYHGTGFLFCAMSIISGFGIAIGRKFTASGFLPDVVESDSTIFMYVGETVRYLLNMPPQPLERKHRLRLAYGNGMRPDVWAKFQDRFDIPEVDEFFSSSEGMLTLLARAKNSYIRGTVGHHGLIFRQMLKNVIVPVEIDHETGDIARYPETGLAKRTSYEVGGEILVNILDKDADTNDFKGYWNNKDATSKKYVRDILKKGDLYYRSGDALRRTDDGHWYFLDRLGDTYRWKSENVSTAEVAEVLGHYSGVAEANVYGVEVPGHEGRAGCAALHLASPDVDFAGLLKHTRTRLPRYAVPVFLRVQRASAHIHNNKQNKVGLRKEGVDPELKGKYESAGKDDVIWWLPPKADQYVKFEKKDWDRLKAAKVRL